MRMNGTSFGGTPPARLLEEFDQALRPASEGGIPPGSYNWINGNIVKNPNNTLTYVPNGGSAVLFVRNQTTPAIVAAKYPAVAAAWLAEYGWPTAADIPAGSPQPGTVTPINPTTGNPYTAIPPGNNIVPGGGDSGIIPGYFNDTGSSMFGPEWISGIPNVAVIGGVAVLGALLLMPKKKGGRKGGARRARGRARRR